MGVLFFLILTTTLLLLTLRFLSQTSFFQILLSSWRSFEDSFHVYQSFEIPQQNESFRQNLLHHKVYTYLNSLTTLLEDSESTELVTGSKSNNILLKLHPNQTVTDHFLCARVSWTYKQTDFDGDNNSFVLRLRKKDKRRILRPYLQHVLSVADGVEENGREIRLHMNLENGRWRSVPFTHPASMETVVLDGDVKNKVKSDLEMFLKSKNYYHRLGRVWKRSYLLYGASGTGKSSFVAAMARFLCYDVYDVDLSRVSGDSDLKTLLLQVKCKSLILIEGLDRFLSEKSTAVSLPGVLSFMDGIISSCGEERVMVFTMNERDLIDEDRTVMRPGRIDVHIHFPLCDFSTFKILANNYLGVKDHKLFGQVEEGFQNGSSLSPAQIGELMISNRASPTRALKSVITALQNDVGGDRGGGVKRSGARLGEHGSGQPVDDGLLCRESVHTVREFRKLYGLLRIGSRRKDEPPLDLNSTEKDGSRHEA